MIEETSAVAYLIDLLHDKNPQVGVMGNMEGACEGHLRITWHTALEPNLGWNKVPQKKLSADK